MHTSKKDYKKDLRAYVQLVSTVKSTRDNLRDGKLDVVQAQEALKQAESHFQLSLSSNVN